MSDSYKIQEHDKGYFITMTVVGWIDLFTRNTYKFVITDSLKFCQENKGLEIYGWCLMTNHLHMICRATKETTLSEIIRDFKKFTAKKLIEQIQIGDEPESREKWLLSFFERAGKLMNRIKNYKVWQDGNQAKVIYSTHFFYEKLKYIHQNPVKELIVTNPEDYLFSSARNYAGLDYVLDIVGESSPTD
ncbi:MAG: transposase [Bacteroidales bacterium]|nr:transposase [Bacteroidales bacterium]